MTTILQIRYPAAPTAVRPSGTLLDAASVTDRGPHDFMPPDATGVFQTFNCLSLGTNAQMPCPPVQLAAPVVSGAAASAGGSLAVGAFRYVVTAVNGRGETVASNEVTGTTATTNLTLTPTWAAISGATSYNVYRTAIGGAAGSETFLATTAGTNYVDNGGVAPGTKKPPTANSATVSVQKTFSAPVYQNGILFGVYGGVTCKAPGFSFEQARPDITAAYEAKETVGVEAALMAQSFATSSCPDLTPTGGAVEPEVGLGILEGDAAVHYAGIPTIHSPRSITTLLFARFAMQAIAGKFYSWQGAKVASGGGYIAANKGPTGSAPAAGEMWMYATGEVVVERGPLQQVESIDRSTNDQYVLLERFYQAAFDCYISAVRVKVT